MQISDAQTRRTTAAQSLAEDTLMAQFRMFCRNRLVGIS